MSLQGKVNDDHGTLNQYTFAIIGLPPLTVTKVSGIPEELQVTTMPDRRVESEGNTAATEVTISIPAHHIQDQAVMELWWDLCKKAQPGYKKDGVVVIKRASGMLARSLTIHGVFIKKRSTPELAMETENGTAEIEWVFSIDEVMPV
jgi:hypothetical protein